MGKRVGQTEAGGGGWIASVLPGHSVIRGQAGGSGRKGLTFLSSMVEFKFV